MTGPSKTWPSDAVELGAQVTDAPLQKDPNVSELIEKQLGSHPAGILVPWENIEKERDKTIWDYKDWLLAPWWEKKKDINSLIGHESDMYINDTYIIHYCRYSLNVFKAHVKTLIWRSQHVCFCLTNIFWRVSSFGSSPRRGKKKRSGSFIPNQLVTHETTAAEFGAKNAGETRCFHVSSCFSRRNHILFVV